MIAVDFTLTANIAADQSAIIADVERKSGKAQVIPHENYMLPQPWVLEILLGGQLIPWNFQWKVHMFPDCRLLYRFLRVTIRHLWVRSFDTLCHSRVECFSKTNVRSVII